MLSLGLGWSRGGYLFASVVGVPSCDQGDGGSTRVVYACEWKRLAMSQIAGRTNWRDEGKCWAQCVSCALHLHSSSARAEGLLSC